MDIKKQPNSNTRSIQLLAIIFFFSLAVILVVFYNMPDLEESERDSIKLPRYTPALNVYCSQLESID